MSTHKQPSNTTLPPRTKLPKLPTNATVSKRPLHRPALPSPYVGASQPKIIYVGSSTPFIATVKRVEKLLKLSDKRLVQSATTLAKHGGRNGKRKRGGDDILEIASEVERLKGKKRRGAVQVDGEEVEGVGEEVTLKGTGKAVGRVMALGAWFQDRGDVYAVRLQTGSVGAIDDITVNEDGEGGEEGPGVETMTQKDGIEGGTNGGNGHGALDDAGNAVLDASAGAEDVEMLGMQADERADMVGDTAKASNGAAKKNTVVDPIPATRIRYASVLEARVSLR